MRRRRRKRAMATDYASFVPPSHGGAAGWKETSTSAAEGTHACRGGQLVCHGAHQEAATLVEMEQRLAPGMCPKDEVRSQRCYCAALEGATALQALKAVNGARNDNAYLLAPTQGPALAYACGCNVHTRFIRTSGFSGSRCSARYGHVRRVPSGTSLGRQQDRMSAARKSPHCDKHCGPVRPWSDGPSDAASLSVITTERAGMPQDVKVMPKGASNALTYCNRDLRLFISKYKTRIHACHQITGTVNAACVAAQN